jgi:hypothetical protein
MGGSGMINEPKTGVKPELVFEEYQEETKKLLGDVVKLRAFVRQLQAELSNVNRELATLKSDNAKTQNKTNGEQVS